MLLSIITPVYNVESYIAETIESILSQSYRNFELILVDDGSTDSSRAICEKYAKFDSRVKLITQLNQGVSAARNKGLYEATGEIIGFVDSDDTIESEMYERLIQIMQLSQSDIVQCCHDRAPYKISSVKQNTPSEYSCVDGREYVRRIFTKQGADYTNQVALWSKIYRRELFDDIRFPLGQTYEDEQETYKICFKAKKIALIDDILYHYIKRENSIITGISPRKMLDKQKSLYDRTQWLPPRIPELERQCISTFFEYSKHIACQLWTSDNREHSEAALSLMQQGIKSYKSLLNRYDRLYVSLIKRGIGKSWILRNDFSPIQNYISRLR